MSAPHQPLIARSACPIAWYRGLIDATLAALAWVVRCRDRAAQRHTLAQLDEHLLRDIGLGRADVETECRKWFWLR